MIKKQLWINLCPRKLYWELSQLDRYAGLAQDEWWYNLEPLKTAFDILKKNSIEGIRLNIFNFEMMRNEKEIDWTPLEKTLQLAKAHQLGVDFCLGPYQYPLWPGIRLPKHLVATLKKSKYLEDTKSIREFGHFFLKAQLKMFGSDRRIKSFYLGNEWHTDQEIESSPHLKKYFISIKQMLQLTRICKRLTKKTIILNTNLDATRRKHIEHVFSPVFQVLGEQGCLALDVYPSQETFSKAPRLYVMRKLETYKHSLQKLQKEFPYHLIFGEFEAQPWGKGQSWKQYFESSESMNQFSQEIYTHTVHAYIHGTNITKITLWGGEFHVIAHLLNRPISLKLSK